MAALCAALRLKAGMFDENSLITRTAVQLLLAVRLKMLAYCKAKQITPQQWLLLQVACAKGLVSKSDGRRMDDVFLMAWKAVWLACSDVLLDFAARIDGEVMQLMADTGHPDVAVDEAQALLKRFSVGYFVSLTDGRTPRALARDVLGGLCDASLTHRVIASGTDLAIITSIRDVLCGLGRLAAKVEAVVLHEGWTRADDMISYAKTMLERAGCHKLSEPEVRLIQDYVFPRFEGRFRPFVSVLELLLKDRGVPIVAHAARIEKMLCEDDSDLGLKSYRFAVRQMEQFSHDDQILGLREKLDEATEGYFLNGYTLRIRESEQVMLLVETGVARLKVQSTDTAVDRSIVDLSYYFDGSPPRFSQPEYEYVAVLDEHLMFQALLQRRGGLEWLMRKAVNRVLKSGYAANQGSEYQHVVSLALLRMFEQRKALKDLPLFEEVLCDETVPKEALQNAVVVLRKGKTHLTLSRPGYGYREHVEAAVKSGTMMISSANEPEPDMAAHGFFADSADDFLREASVLIAMHQDMWAREAWNRALFSWDFMEAMDRCKLQVSFLVVFPPKIGKREWFKVEEKDGKLRLVIVVGRENANRLFTDGEVEDFQKLVHKKKAKQQVKEEMRQPERKKRKLC